MYVNGLYNGTNGNATETISALQPGELRLGNVRMYPKVEGDRFEFVHVDGVAMYKAKEEAKLARLKLLAFVAMACVYLAIFAGLAVHFRC